MIFFGIIFFLLTAAKASADITQIRRRYPKLRSYVKYIPSG
jgi:hypothetical protein